uniref:peptidylprolyl isomerase n=1 Tax=Callorhinchus milii TaxID=7868 RepID=A0A4W3J3K0_CALMI
MEHEVGDSVQYLEGWIDVLGNGLLKKITLKSGNAQLGKPQPSQNVSIWIKMMHENRKEVEDPQYISFIIGEGDVNEALEICVPLMEVEETSLILADVKFCYLSKECLPPGTKLLLEVKLLSVTGRSLEEKSESEQLELISRVRKKGNDCFQSEEYQLAIVYYNYAVKMIESEEKVKCYSNMAACHLKTRNLKETVSCCDVVLQHQPHHCKALFRKGKVLALEQIQFAHSNVPQTLNHKANKQFYLGDSWTGIWKVLPSLFEWCHGIVKVHLNRQMAPQFNVSFKGWHLQQCLAPQHWSVRLHRFKS